MQMANYSLIKFHTPGEAPRGYCATIGFFDGVHRGHLYLIERMKEEAARRGLASLVITFEEHPRLALTHTRYWPELLTTNEEKVRLLRATGIDGCAMLHFDTAMSVLTSREFMETILRDELGVKCLLIGYDHHFGSDLSAGYKEYVMYGKALGIEVLRATPFECDELRVSSSAVRRFLTGGNVEMACACLGRPYRLEGTVVEGHRAGTLMGYPTANLQPDCIEQVIPGRGVYAARAYLDGFSYKAMVNIGRRPTLDNGPEQTIEAHLLDYSGGDLYGTHLILDFCRRIRDEQRFDSIPDLQRQLGQDADRVREILSEA